MNFNFCRTLKMVEGTPESTEKTPICLFGQDFVFLAQNFCLPLYVIFFSLPAWPREKNTFFLITFVFLRNIFTSAHVTYSK